MGKTIYICKICKEKYSTMEGLYSHLENEHGDAIPEDMCVEQFYYFLKTGKEHGKCVQCGKPTLWNDKTKKYKRFCEDPRCIEEYKEIVRSRMIGKYGKVNLLNDPEQQRKMLMNRSIAGTYNFNGVMITYVGSYELDFLKTMDIFLDWDENDIIMPSPHNYYYMYNGEQKLYIPDVFIPSLGLEIEIKDGGDNPNMHHKIQEVDKEKEKLKDEVMRTQKIFHYIKITNKNYYNLFDFFDKMKEGLEKYEDYDKIPKIIITEDIKTKQVNPKSKSLLKKEAQEVLKENMEVVEEKLEPDKALVWLDKPMDKLTNKKINVYHASTVDIKNNKIDPISINVGATRFSTPRWSTYCWDNIDDAEHWGVTWAINEIDRSCLYRGHVGKTLIARQKGESDEDVINRLLKEKPYYFIYICEIPISKLEVGSAPSIKEYTVSESLIINKKQKIKITKDMIKKHFDIMDLDEVEFISRNFKLDDFGYHRGKCLNKILINVRDKQRQLIKRDIKAGKVNIGDDISMYKKAINGGVYKDLKLAKESYNHYITLNINNNLKRGLYGFRDDISSISFDDKHIKRVNHQMQPIEECDINKEKTTEIKFGYNEDILPYLNKSSNQGSFLIWNKSDSIESLLESISEVWFDSKLPLDKLHKIGGDE